MAQLIDKTYLGVITTKGVISHSSLPLQLQAPHTLEDREATVGMQDRLDTQDREDMEPMEVMEDREAMVGMEDIEDTQVGTSTKTLTTTS